MIFNSIKCNEDKFYSYLSGLIEGDGSLKVPYSIRSKKGNYIYPSITITFVYKDLPLASLLAQKLNGKINKAKGDYLVLSVYKLDAVYNILKNINGRFRTPKIEALYRMIDWFNDYNGLRYKFEKISYLPLDTSDIVSNGWFAGFSDSDSHFFVGGNLTDENKLKNFQISYRLSQRYLYKNIATENINKNDYEISNFSYLNIMTIISQTFETKVNVLERNRKRLKNDTLYSYVENGLLVSIKSKKSSLGYSQKR